MLDLAHAVREQIVKETPPRKGAAPGAFAMRGLRQMAVWGVTAVAALAVAVMSGHGESASRRLAAVFYADSPPAPAHVFDAEAETRRLAATVNSLAADSEEIRIRLASVEHNMDDVTGSISKEIEEADAAKRFDDGPNVVATAMVTASMSVTGQLPAADPAALPAFDGVSPPASAPQYGVDIGSGLTIEALRARWAGLRSAHPALFEGLQAIISVREVPHASHVELRLIAGPFPQAGTASQFCKSLSLFGLFCQPAVFDGQRLALR